MKRGDVYWCAFRPPIGRRPVLVLTRNSALGYLSSVIVVEVTTTIRNSAAEVALGETDGMPQACVLNLHSLHTVRKAALEGYVTTLSDSRLREVENALCWSLGMDHLLNL